ncbi:MAG: SurA N-terminal domain-containing protein [Deltaproteobacteria bacterium]|nr:SurA N-terminal domain-containing protein [Deltaproteobacteria bacterium]
MNKKTCAHCGQEIRDERDTYCPECEALHKSSKKKRLWYSVAGAGLFFIVGWALWCANTGSWDLSWDALTGKPAAIINGEPVAASALRERFKINRTMLERQYGKEIFAGERSKTLLVQLERDILERMLEDRLVAQEASRMGIQVSDEQVRQELERIGREIYGDRKNFQESLAEDSVSQEYLMSHIRYLLLCREIKRLKFPSRSDPDTDFSAWLSQARGRARVAIYPQERLLQNVSQGGGTCCGSGVGGSGGGCGDSRRSAAPLDPELKSKASAAALAAYLKENPAGKGIGARVTDYGCHIQVDIEQSGKIVKSYTYQDGKVFEI